MTSSAETQPGEPSYLKLEETAPACDSEAADIHGVIREFSNESELPDVLKDYDSPQIRLSVKAYVSRLWLPISRSYRLLYVGALDRWAVTHINTHIGAALNATPSSSRFNIVQGSSFDGSPSSSKVQLEPSGSELVVDHCATPTVEEDASGEHHAVITLDDGQKIKFGPGPSISPSTASLPDLIVIGHAAAHDVNHRLVRDILKQNDIPTIEIAVVRPYSSESFKFETADLRLSLEGRHSPSDEFEALKTLPIDLYTFLSLDPAQLNRHLAYLNAHSSTVKSTTPTRFTGKSRSLRYILPNLSSTATAPKARCTSEPVKWGNWRGYARFLSVVLLLVLAILGPLATSGVLQNLYNNRLDVHSQAIPSTMPLETTLAPISTSKPVTSSPSASAGVHISKELTVVPPESKPRSSWLDRAMPRKGTQMDYFNITVTGDHQFELHVSQSKPKVQIHVSLNSEVIPVEIIRPNPNTYVVSLEQKYAVNIFNITAVVMRQPLLHQSFEVKLGSNGSALSSVLDGINTLSKSIKYDLGVAQTNLRNLSAQASRNLQAGMVYLKDRSTPHEKRRSWKQQLKDSKQTVAEHVQRARKLATRNFSAGSKVTNGVSRSLKATREYWTSRASSAGQHITSQLWLQSRPLRTSPGLLRTRERALRVRCSVEKTLGKEGTRSCNLLRDSR
jgi:uncharacterized membrane protein